MFFIYQIKKNGMFNTNYGKYVCYHYENNICKVHLKISKGYSEAVSRISTDNGQRKRGKQMSIIIHTIPREAEQHTKYEILY